MSPTKSNPPERVERLIRFRLRLLWSSTDPSTGFRTSATWKENRHEGIRSEEG